MIWSIVEVKAIDWRAAILIMELVRAFDGSWRAHIVAVDRFPGAHLLVLQLPSGLI